MTHSPVVALSQTVLAFAGLLVLVAAVHGRSGDKASSKPARVFDAATDMVVTIRAPWRELARKKDETRYPATLAYVDAAGQTRWLNLTVERRGITRQNVCSFPPLKLRFDKKGIKGTPFRGSASLKLVTHCGSGGRWAPYPVIELLAYRINNLLTDYSFRVRPLAITYVDSRNESADGPRFGFLIEDDDDLARRNDLERLDVARPRVAQLDPRGTSRFALFQYMIGNTDWSVLSGPSGNRCCHNTVLIGSKSEPTIQAVPYDFDSAGLVDAHYAAPSEKLPISKVSERIYRGFCEFNPELDELRIEFLEKEAAILDLVRNQGQLEPRSRQKVLDYLAEFFGIMRDPAAFEENIRAKCRK
ncbi:hypothetical protein [Dokdonella sp.]|uniref:hypothetical protein n=1 Tax=Dokdonella sp. TaxID=2291710 RepID=UPI003529288F